MLGRLMVLTSLRTCGQTRTDHTLSAIDKRQTTTLNSFDNVRTFFLVPLFILNLLIVIHDGFRCNLSELSLFCCITIDGILKILTSLEPFEGAVHEMFHYLTHTIPGLMGKKERFISLSGHDTEIDDVLGLASSYQKHTNISFWLHEILNLETL